MNNQGRIALESDGRRTKAIPLALEAHAWSWRPGLMLERAGNGIGGRRGADFIEWCARLPESK